MRNQEIVVSIKCLIYNHEQYIRQCLDGIVMQKTNFCFEAIVHDDASTDSSAAIIREYAEKYPHIIKPIYETENQYSKRDGSLTRIMNAACKGKYIAVCEGDDYWIDPLKLQKQVDFLENHPKISYVFTNRLIYSEITGKTILQKYKPRLYTINDVLAGFNSGLQTSCFRRECIVDNFSLNYVGINGDRLYPYLSSLTGYFTCLKDVTAVYRKTGSGISTKIADENWFEHASLDFYKFHKKLSFPNMTAYCKGEARYLLTYLRKGGGNNIIRSYRILSGIWNKKQFLRYFLILLLSIKLLIEKIFHVTSVKNLRYEFKRNQ